MILGSVTREKKNKKHLHFLSGLTRQGRYCRRPDLCCCVVQNTSRSVHHSGDDIAGEEQALPRGGIDRARLTPSLRALREGKSNTAQTDLTHLYKSQTNRCLQCVCVWRGGKDA